MVKERDPAQNSEDKRYLYSAVLDLELSLLMLVQLWKISKSTYNNVRFIANLYFY